MISSDLFPLLRNLTIFFAAAMLLKYFIFLVISPFHSVKEKLRQIRVKRYFSDSQQALKQRAPLVSVIIPAWNEEVGIIKTIKSVVSNDYPNIEIIVVNDGSTDKSHETINKYLEKNKDELKDRNRVIRYCYKENGGKGHALNHGIDKLRGDIVLTVDADSILHKKAISRLVRYFADPKIDTVVGNVRVVSKNNLIGLLQTLEYSFGFYFKRAHSVMNSEYIFGGACAAFRRSKTFEELGKFDHTNKTEDIEMSLRTRFHGLHNVYAEDVVCYTEGASSINGLINQRLRWKKGRFDTFAKYRRLFFSLDPKHNRFLSWFVMPYALFSEIQLLFEPIGIALLVSYSIVSGDYISLALGISFILITYIVVSFFSGERINYKLIVLFPFTWPLFYILVWVEYLALLKSMVMILRGDDIVWQKWERQGIEGE